MKCFDCKEYDAEYILVEYEQVLPLCKGCVNENIDIEGEINLKIWSINELELIFNEINKNLKYGWGKYARLLQEYNKLKKKAEK